MLSTNKDKLVKISVMGHIDSPNMPPVPWTPHFISRDGKPSLLPYVGGIVYNVRVGDPALGWAGEVIEPGVSIRNKDAQANRALKVYSSVGNEAVVMTGRGKGTKGVVIGKSGRFADHIIIDFPPAVLDNLGLGDSILVRACGVGLEIDGFPGLRIKNLAPEMLEQLGVTTKGGRVQVPVVATLPPEMMGAGAGLDSDGGALQIQTGAPGAAEKYGLTNLRLGDLVAVQDYEAFQAPGLMRGAVSIGVVCHCDSMRAGFGPGMTMILTARLDGGKTNVIEPVIDANANIARILKIGAFRA
jgi:hypothetical protein